MTQTFTFPSRSSGATHAVKVDGQQVTCTCRGFDTPSKCWHVRDVAEKLGIPIYATSTTPSLFQFETNNPSDAERAGLPPLSDEKQRIQLQAIWDAGGFIAPMLASALPEGKTLEDYATPDWHLEEKVDGHRMIVRVAPETGIVTAWARSGIVRILPRHILNAARMLPPGTYDGELHCPGHTSTDVTRVDLQHRLKLTLFDMLHVYDGQTREERSCMHMPWHERRLLLEHATSQLDDYLTIQIVRIYEVSTSQLQAIWDAGGEGAVIKHRAIKYAPGKRIKEWVKFKKEQSAEVIVTGFKAGKYGPHSVIVGVDKHGIEIQVKSRNDEWRTDFAKNANAFIGRRLVIQFQERTKDGKYRHPMVDHFLEKLPTPLLEVI